MFVTQTQHDNQKVKAWLERQRNYDKFSMMMVEIPKAARHPFEVTHELRRLGVVGWLDEGMHTNKYVQFLYPGLMFQHRYSFQQ